MSIKSIVKAGLLTVSLVAIAAPALAQPQENDRPARGERGGNNGGGNENRGARGGDNGGNRDNGGGRGGESRPAPAPAPAAAPVPTPAPVVRAAPPVATPAVDNGRFQRGGNEQPRPGTPQWYSQRGATPPPPAADRNNAGDDRSRNQGNWQANGGRDRGNNDGRSGNWNRDNDRRDNNGRTNDGRDNNWNRDRDGRDNNWRGNDGRNGNDSRNWNGNDNRGNWNNGRPGVRPPVANRWDGMRRWDNNSWRNDRRYDWRDWRNAHRNVFRLPSYRAPYGWNRSYSRFSIGIYLDSILFGSDYWIDDPWTYRLPPVYGTLRWVRYHDDALLIDIRDGYVVDVIYDFFW